MFSRSFLILVLIGAAVADVDSGSSEEILSKTDNEDAFLTTIQLVKKYGYIGETYRVQTEDGYILEMHRIAGSKLSPAAEDKPVVFLMHGIISSSADWVVSGPDYGLAYILADAGYDVWMGNARGSTYSKRHATIKDLNGAEFWNFSWHEIGYYDIPAMIDYILTHTDQEDLVYIGHSQGTTSFFVMASTRTEYNKKIKAMFALAPVAYMGHMTSPLMQMVAIGTNEIALLLKLIGANEFLPTSRFMRLAGAAFCNDDALTQLACNDVIFVIAGFDADQFNSTMLPVIMAHTPAGASTRQMLHYGQGVRSKKFRWYDHGAAKNLMVYHSITPPSYDLSLVKAPVHLFYSTNDWLAATKDVDTLNSELGNVVEMTLVNNPKWNHVDYLFGIDARKNVYDSIMKTLKITYGV